MLIVIKTFAIFPTQNAKGGTYRLRAEVETFMLPLKTSESAESCRVNCSFATLMSLCFTNYKNAYFCCWNENGINEVL